MTLTAFLGGIVNSGTILATGSGVFGGDGIVAGGQASRGAVTLSYFSGGITNNGAISAHADGIVAGGQIVSGGSAKVSTFLGGITNLGGGTISAGETGIYLNSAQTFSGGITNFGSISGGQDGIYVGVAGVSVFDAGTITGNEAIVFSGSADTLTLASGYDINGNVSGTTGNVFQLGGTASGSFDLASIGATAQFRAFSTFDVVGATWTVSSSGSGAWNIDSGATLRLASGGTLSNTVVSNGGTLVVLSGGHADPTSIGSGGSEIVSAGGTDSGTIISGGGTLEVLAGGFAALGTIDSGASALIDGGTVSVHSSVTVSGPITFASGGGTLEIGGSGSVLSGFMSGLTVSGLAVGDIIDLTNVAFASGGTAFVSGSELVISVGGSAYDLAFGPANSLASDAFAVTNDGVSGTDITVTVGGVTVSSGSSHSVSSGTTDNGDIVLSGGTLLIESGGAAFDTLVSGGGKLIVESGGVADPTSLLSSGIEIISGGGTDDGAQLSGGTQLDFGLATSATVSSGGTQAVEVGRHRQRHAGFARRHRDYRVGRHRLRHARPPQRHRDYQRSWH